MVQCEPDYTLFMHILFLRYKILQYKTNLFHLTSQTNMKLLLLLTCASYSIITALPIIQAISLGQMLHDVEAETLHDLKHGRDGEHDESDEMPINRQKWKPRPRNQSRRLRKLQHKHHAGLYDGLKGMFGKIPIDQ